MKVMRTIRLFFVIICWTVYCWGMESSPQEKPCVFQSIDLCVDALQSDISHEEKNIILEQMKQQLGLRPDERFAGWTPILYLLHHFGSNEALVRAATNLLLTEKDERTLRMRVNARAPHLNRTALHYAAGYGYFWLVEQLVQAQADIQTVDTNRADALHYACGTDNTLVSDSCKEALCDVRQHEALHRNGAKFKINIPAGSSQVLGAFCYATTRSPWQAYTAITCEVGAHIKRYALNVAHRAQIIHFLVNKMLFYAASDVHNKTPESYAQNSGYFLLTYILNNQHSEPSINEAFFNHGLRAWSTIFGIFDQLVA